MMKKSRIEKLEERIARLEAKQESDFEALKEQLEITYESLKPTHIVSNIIDNALSNGKLKKSIFKIGLRSTLSYLIKRMLFKNSNSIMSNMTSSILKSIIYKKVQTFLQTNNH